MKHQNADAMSRMLLTKCGWAECPDCKSGFAPFADKDESVLTTHDEELIIEAGPAPKEVVAEAATKAHPKVLSLRTENVQANMVGPLRSQRLARALSTPPLVQMQRMPPLQATEGPP